MHKKIMGFKWGMGSSNKTLLLTGFWMKNAGLCWRSPDKTYSLQGHPGVNIPLKMSIEQ